MKALITFMGKKAFIIAICVIVVLVVCICISPGFKSLSPTPPPVSQAFENVVSIELLDTHEYDFRAPDSTIHHLYTLNEDEFEEFWNNFMELSYRTTHPPYRDYDILAVRITYQDGCVDIIGTGMCTLIDVNGNKTNLSRNVDAREDIINLFAQYVDTSLLPDADTIIS